LGALRLFGGLEARRERGHLTSGEEDAQRFEFGGDVAVAPGGVGLAFERLELAPDLA
jgi:hypothetical protein